VSKTSVTVQVGWTEVAAEVTSGTSGGADPTAWTRFVGTVRQGKAPEVKFDLQVMWDLVGAYDGKHVAIILGREGAGEEREHDPAYVVYNLLNEALDAAETLQNVTRTDEDRARELAEAAAGWDPNP
jgi:hypothetical protein